jgi:hypothetical protein
MSLIVVFSVVTSQLGIIPLINESARQRYTARQWHRTFHLNERGGVLSNRERAGENHVLLCN